MTGRRADAVVVGSGPGGSVTARALAEAGLDVIVVEEGEWSAPDAYPAYSAEQMEHQYRNAGLTVALGRPPIAYTEGRCAGGGSEVNSGLYHRAPAEVLDAWRRVQAIEDLGEESLAPHYETVERELGIEAAAELSPASETLLRGARSLGWAAVDVPRWRTGGDRAEQRGMTRTYLPAAIAAGARLLCGTRAGTVLFRDGRATGVRVRNQDGRIEELHADHVFACGGAIQTPALLQRSGLRGRVGHGLSVHPTVKAVAELDEQAGSDQDVATIQVKERPWLSIGGSASRESLIALALAENWDDFGPALAGWRHQSVFYAAIQSTGRGRVRALPGFDDPLVGYRLTSADRLRLRSAMKRLLHVLLAGGSRRILPSFAGAPVVTDRAGAAAAIARFSAGRAGVMTVHLTGTVAMGEDLRRAAADSFGGVHGRGHLWVNDASLLPWAPGVNPQGTVMALAHRNVARFLADRGVPAGGAR